VASAVLPPAYLHAPTVATVVTALGLILVTTDLLFSALAYSADPRLRIGEKGAGDA